MMMLRPPTHTSPRRALASVVLAGVLVLIGACAGQETPSGWVTINATLSVDQLEGFVPATAEAAAPVTMSLSDARAKLPFAFGLPAWAPAGFVLQDEVDAVLPSAGSEYAAVMVTWQNADEEAIVLRASPATGKRSYDGSAGSAEPAEVNRQPATLRRSGSQAAERLSLNWNQGQVAYALSAAGGVVSAADLVRMAESLR